MPSTHTASPVKLALSGNCARSRESSRSPWNPGAGQRQTLIVPLDNSAEAAVVEGVEVYGVGSLSEVVHFLRGDISSAPVRPTNYWSAARCSENELDSGEVSSMSKAPSLGVTTFSACQTRRRSRRCLQSQYSNVRCYSVRVRAVIGKSPFYRSLQIDGYGNGSLQDLYVSWAWITEKLCCPGTSTGGWGRYTGGYSERPECAS
jgi:hypothetical protein